jgi:hypothetical protein
MQNEMAVQVMTLKAMAAYRPIVRENAVLEQGNLD